MSDPMPMHQDEPQVQPATASDIIDQLVAGQRVLSETLNTLMLQMAKQPVAQVHAKVAAPSKNPMKDPEPFKGDAKELRRFLAYFTMWASLQGEPLMKEGLRDEKAWIASALSYFRGDASHWAQSFLQQIYDHDISTSVTHGKKGLIEPFPTAVSD
ncbi:hypothetical protein BKA70DRAFT_1441743 [Coprinopsis sp. MPI-PUGE-AT-0042]|nr:hypothetical protein BKA70DRAFT_1441743 [Coprinopsis sp. MPI-PUGE-AT-0042]